VLKEQGREARGKTLFALGIAFNVVLNPICDLSGYAFAPASVIAPFTGMDIVWNTLVAPCTLGEILTRRRLCCATTVFLCATLTVFFKENQQPWTPERAQDIFQGLRFWLYAAGFLLWYVINAAYLMRAYPPRSRIRGFSLGATAGSLAGNMWCTKVVATFAEQCIGGNCKPFTSWSTWVLFGGAIFFPIANLSYMAKGMQQYEALFMVTVFQGSNIVANCISASVVLEEMDGAEWWKIFGYSACIVIMVGSMVMLAIGEAKATVEADPEPSGPVETGVGVGSLETSLVQTGPLPSWQSTSQQNGDA
jgi:hypothetical protein